MKWFINCFGEKSTKLKVTDGKVVVYKCFGKNGMTHYDIYEDDSDYAMMIESFTTMKEVKEYLGIK